MTGKRVPAPAPTFGDALAAVAELAQRVEVLADTVADLEHERRADRARRTPLTAPTRVADPEALGEIILDLVVRTDRTASRVDDLERVVDQLERADRDRRREHR